MATEIVLRGEPGLKDFDILDDDFALILDDDVAELQSAMIAAYQEVSTIPGMEEVGVEWQKFVLGTQEILNIDGQIRKAIVAATGSARYSPDYVKDNDEWRVVLKKVE